METDAFSEDGEDVAVDSPSGSQVVVLLAEFGSVLVTRSMGSRVAETLVARLRKGGSGSVLVVDFDGVEILDYSFSDEAVGKVGTRCAAGEFGERYLLVTGLTDELADNLESALRLRGMPMAYASSLGWRILGPVRSHLNEVAGLLGERGQVTAREVADELGIALNTASNRLTELHRLGVVSRRESALAGGGKQFVYSVTSEKGSDDTTMTSRKRGSST